MLFSNLPGSLRIGVIRGGKDPEYDTSLKTGAYILKTLSQTHNPVDIFISKDGSWHVQGMERNPDRILKNLDVVINSMHGNFGEDGGLQEILNNHGIKYIGSDRLSSAFAFNRHLAKEKLTRNGIKTPDQLQEGTDTAVGQSDSLSAAYALFKLLISNAQRRQEAPLMVEKPLAVSIPPSILARR
jgi:D-alanine-D-alanine ligase-like ATP-grasp enzyme